MEKITWTTVPRRVGDLKPLAYNPRKATESGQKKMGESLDEFGLVEIPVINADNTLIAGHRRWELLIGIDADASIDVRLPSRLLTEAEIKKYNILSNTHVGIWDVKLLEEVFSKELNLGDFGVDLKALQRAEWRQIKDPIEDDFDASLPEFAVTLLGDFWDLVSPEKGLRHRVVCGSSTEADVVAKLMNGLQKPVLMSTDPPYGVNYDPLWREKSIMGNEAKSRGKVKNDDRFRWPEAYTLFEGNVAYVWHAGKYATEVAEDLQKSGFEIAYQIIWNKHTGAIGRGDYHWKHEPCWYAVRKGKTHNWQGARDQYTVWDIQNLSSRSVIEAEGQTGHGTQKPIECMARPIRNNTEPGQSVYDPFLGSGTTLAAAEQLERNCLGIELSEQYCDVIVRRWMSHMKKNALPFEIHLNGQPATAEMLEKLCPEKSE